MTAPPLRSYQRDVIDRVDAEIAAGRRRLLLVAPTGSGKTVIAAELVRRAEGRVLFLVHRRELLQQASRKLHDAGIDHGLIAPDFPARPGERVQVASIATLNVRAVRSAVMSLPPADMIVVDEAHHARARTWAKVIESYPDAVVIGLTATPARADGRGLGVLFEAMVECPQVPELVRDRYLVGTVVYAPSRPDLSGVRTSRGDYVEAQLAAVMDRPELVGDVVTNWHQHAEGKRTIVFATGVQHSVHLRDEFARSAVTAEHLDGSTPTEERDAILRRLADGVTDVVCNAMVLTEGFDCPEIGAIVLARPTKSLVLFRQMIGRGLRPADGKPHCIVIDHAGAVHQHGWIDEPVTWTLSADEKADTETLRARRRGQARELVDCPECGAAMWRGRNCKACGWQWRPKPKPIDFVDGDLGRVDRDRRVHLQVPTMAEKERFHAELMWICRQRGYNPGWAAHKHREKFGHWPPFGKRVTPVEPRPETMSWVRSRQIAYAKGRAKAGAA